MSTTTTGDRIVFSFSFFCLIVSFQFERPATELPGSACTVIVVDDLSRRVCLGLPSNSTCSKSLSSSNACKGRALSKVKVFGREGSEMDVVDGRSLEETTSWRLLGKRVDRMVDVETLFKLQSRERGHN